MSSDLRPINLEMTTLISNATKNGTSDTPGTVNVDNLYPAIFQCFAIILAGYIAGRARLITPAQGKGIGTFVGKFCLPALLFKNMVELNFDSVNWYFLLGIGISKTTVFVGIAIFTLLIKRPINYGYAGLFAIFATQSNDFALGYPILKALYEETNPDYLQYIYLVAPISLVLLNPIGFTMMEIHKRNQTTSHTQSKLVVILHVTKDVLTNPIVFMVLIGIAGNFIFQQKMPSIINDVLEVLGNAYSATALFYLGLSLVGKVQGQLGLRLIVPLLLICAKTLLLPLITWQVVGALEMGEVNNSRSLSMFGFLYGTFPTAPSVFLYASQFSIAQDIIATGMVVCTFLSAPLMFASAKMMTVVVNSETDYKSLLLGSSFDISVVSLVCNVWVLALLIFSRKFKKMPHHFLVLLIIGQMLSCTGMIIYDGLDSKVEWQHYLQFIVLLVGVFTTRCQVAVISIALYFLHCRSLCYVLRIRLWLYALGIGFPILCTGSLLIFGEHHMNDETDPSFHYGSSQAIVSVIVLSVCSVINIIFLVKRQRNAKYHDDQLIQVKTRGNLSDMDEDGNVDISVTKRLLPDMSPRPSRMYVNEQKIDHEDQHCTDIEDLVPNGGNIQTDTPLTRSTTATDSSASDELYQDGAQDNTCPASKCNYEQREKCAGRLKGYYSINQVVQVEDTAVPEVKVKKPVLNPWEEYQTSRFIILLLVLQVSMFTGLFLCTWKMFNNGTSGIYVEIEFLDGFFNYGQSLVVFTIFGFDTRLMILPCIRRWRRWFYGVEAVYIPPKEEMSEEDKHVCDQFNKYHKQNCVRDIVRDMKYRFRTYSKVFSGSVLCDWLVEVGLSEDRSEALNYGRTLLRCQIISHVTSEHDFHDMPYFYRFTSDDDFSNLNDKE